MPECSSLYVVRTKEKCELVEKCVGQGPGCYSSLQGNSERQRAERLSVKGVKSRVSVRMCLTECTFVSSGKE